MSSSTGMLISNTWNASLTMQLLHWTELWTVFPNIYTETCTTLSLSHISHTAFLYGDQLRNIEYLAYGTSRKSVLEFSLETERHSLTNITHVLEPDPLIVKHSVMNSTCQSTLSPCLKRIRSYLYTIYTPTTALWRHTKFSTFVNLGHSTKIIEYQSASQPCWYQDVLHKASLTGQHASGTQLRPG